MCGICGVLYADSNKTVNAGLLHRMCEAITHRGPDDEGYYISGPVGLGMRRLSIIDLAGGKQPIHNENKSVQVVFNGEIYNYESLKSKLESHGHAFYTHSDTETIVHAYEEFGADCVKQLRGMFSFALWDSERQQLLLAIDRFGIKPLYYYFKDQDLVFGSELKSLLASGLISREIDFEALAQYFTFGFIPAPLTIFRGVYKLPPGHLLRWTPTDDVVVQQYWDLPRACTKPNRPLAQTRHQLREVLKDAVRSHLVSDVPLGAFLSGGIDSSTVVALMSEVSSEPVKTFSIGFADQKYNELDKARLVAQRFNTDHHELIVEPKTVDILPNIVSHFGEPFADSSALPTYYLSKMAREFVKVVLSGDGGDELFLGYTIFQGVEFARYVQKIPPLLRRMPATLLTMFPKAGNPSWNDRVTRWRKWAADSALPPELAYRSKISQIGLSSVLPLLSDDVQQQLTRHDSYQVVSETVANGSTGNRQHPLERFVYAGVKLGLAGDMLVKVDRMSMANSLEVRVPLLDHVLAEFVATIPVKQRFPRWRLKGLLRDTMSDVLPSAILNQPKRGFAVPLPNWFRGDLDGFVATVLLSDQARNRGYFNLKAIEGLIKRHREGKANFGSVIWSLLVFELWCQEVLD